MGKKKMFLLIIILFIIVGCKTTSNEEELKDDYVDAQFMTDIENSFQSRLDSIEKHKKDLSYEENFDNLEILVNDEKAILYKYEELKFKDPKLKKLAKDYIEGLKDQEKGLNYYFSDEYKSGVLWNEGSSKRYVALTELVDDYGLDIDENVMKQLRQTSQLVDEEKKLNKEVDEINKNINFELIEDSFGWKEYAAVVENTTDITFSYFELNIKIIDKEGVTVENPWSNTENWNPGEKVRFEFMTDKEFSEIKWEYNYYTD